MAKTEFDELLKIGLNYDIRLKNDSEFHDCQLLVKDLDCRMIKIGYYVSVANDKFKIYKKEIINMDEIFKVTLPKKSRYFWIYGEGPADNSASLYDVRLTDEDISFNKNIKFYNSVDDAVKDIVIEKIAKSKNPKDWRLSFYGAGSYIARYTGKSLLDNGWEGTRSRLVNEILGGLEQK